MSDINFEHLNLSQRASIRLAHKEGQTVRSLAIKYGVKGSTIEKILAK